MSFLKRSHGPPRHATVAGILVALIFGVLTVPSMLRGEPQKGGEKKATGNSDVASSLDLGAISRTISPFQEEAPPETRPVPKGYAQRSTYEARRLNDEFVKKGLVTFVNNACPNTSRDFQDQLARPYTNRGVGRGTYIKPEIWQEIMVIARGQQRRHSPKPYVAVSCLARDHSINVKNSSARSEHPGGGAADIGVIGGQHINSGTQHYGDHVSQAIEDLWAARFYPCQLISWHGSGGIGDVVTPGVYRNRCAGFSSVGAFKMENHGDHLHIDAPR